MFSILDIKRWLRPRTDLGFLYLHMLFQSFAVSLLQIFVPVYLLAVGFALPKVLFYLLVEWTVFGLFSPLYAKLIQKLSMRNVIILRIPVFFAVLMLLTFFESSLVIQEFYYLIAVLNGFSGSLYTLATTSLFAESMGERNHGEKTGKFIAIPRLTAVAGPAVGGILSTFAGFPALFIFTTLLLLVSIIPISFIKKPVKRSIVKLNVFKTIFSRKREFAFLMFYGIKAVAVFIVLPMAIYLSFQSTLSMGFLVSIISFLSAIFMIYIGKISDRHTHWKILRSGAFLSSIVLFLIGMFMNHWLLVPFSLLIGIVGVVMDVPYENHIYNRSRKYGHPLEFLAFKEFSLFAGRLVFFVILILAGKNLDLAFYLGSLSSASFMFF